MSNKARLFLEDNSSIRTQLVKNGTFNGSLFGWVNEGDWRYSSGAAWANWLGSNRLFQYITVVPGVTYTIKFFVRRPSTIWKPGGTLTMKFGGPTFSYTTGGWKTETVTATGGNAIVFEQNTFFHGSVDNVTIFADLETPNAFEELHLADDTFVNLNFSIADIEDISKRGTTFSKTITIPSTSHNDNVLDHLYDLDVKTDDRYLNKKIPALLYYGDMRILKGVMEITKVDTVHSNNQAYYEVILRGNTKSFADEISSKYLIGNENSTDDLDFSSYNHPFTVNNIMKTWYNSTYPAKPTHLYGSGYYYPIIDYNDKKSNHYNFEELRPAIYIKEIFDKIMVDAGYTYTSAFMLTDEFKSLITPFVGKLRTSEEELEKRKFRAGLSYDIVNQEGYGSSSSTRPQRYLYHAPAVTTASNCYNVRIADDSESAPLNFFDNGGNFNPSTTKYTVPAKGMYNFHFAANARPLLYDSGQVAAGYYIPVSNDSGVARMELTVNMIRQRGSASKVIGSKVHSVPLSKHFNAKGWTYAVGSRKTFLTDIALSVDVNNKEFEAGDTVRIQICLNNKLVHWINLLGQKVTLQAFYGSCDLFRANPDGSGNAGLAFWNQPLASDGMFLGEIMDMNSLLPKKVKQIDFVKSIIKMFNLVVESDPDKDNHLLIEPRNNYMALGDANPKDWSLKLDRSQAIEIERIPTLIDKNVKFTYEDGEDHYNKDYQDKYEDGYGNWEIKNEDLTQNEEEVGLIFAATPGDEIPGTDFIVPELFDKDSNGIVNRAFKMRILHRVDIIDAPGSTFANANTSGVKVLNVHEYSAGKIVTTGFLANTIPTASHMNDPYAPTHDLNWGYSKKYYNTLRPTTPSLPTWGNLYNVYWRAYIELLIDKNSKMVTAHFNLSENDIYNFRFYDKIQIDGQYYTVNRINDWNPDVLTEVVLIKDKISALPETAPAKVIDTEEVLEYNDIAYRSRRRTSSQSDNTTVQQQNTRRSFQTAAPLTREMYEPDATPLVSGQTWNDLSGSTAITMTVSASTLTSPTIITEPSRGYSSGVNNYIDSRNFLNIGNDNTHSGATYNTMTVGDNNTYLDGVRNGTIIGSNNTMGGNITGSTIIGKGITVKKSDTIVLGAGTILTKTPITPIVDVISAPNLDGDQINPFNRLKPIQVLSGGDISDGVRPLRSENTTFVVDSRTSVTTSYNKYTQINLDADGNPVE